MTKSTEIDFEKIHSLDKSSIIEYIRGISKPTFKNSKYWNLGVYAFNCAAPWIEKGDIDVIKELIKIDFRIISRADNLNYKVDFSRDLIIFSLQEIYKQQIKSNLSELEYLSNQKIDQAILKEAFSKKDLLCKFLEFGLSQFPKDFIKEFPWNEYPELQASCFVNLPLKLRKHSKDLCLSFILNKDELSINDFLKIPKEFKSDQLFMKLIFNRFAYQKTKREWERVSRLEKFYKTTQDNIFWKDEFNLCLYLTFGAKQGDHIFLDFKDLDLSMKKSYQVKKLILRNNEVRNFHEIYDYIDLGFIRFISFEDRYYLYGRYQNESNKNIKNPYISALLEKNVFHLDGLDPHILILTKSEEKRYLEFLEKFNIPKEYVDTSL
tara:strand:- start:571 stop:1707 length:1137 start_codon:yes stop_codon:yes gene_type:complete